MSNEKLVHIVNAEGIPACKYKGTGFVSVNFGYHNAKDVNCARCRYHAGKPFYDTYMCDELTYGEIEEFEKFFYSGKDLPKEILSLLYEVVRKH